MRNASLLRRFAAILYDSLLVFALLVILAVVSVTVLGGQSVHAGGPVFLAIYNLIRFFIPFLYFVGYWTYRGRTLGMQSWGLQLLTTDGQVPGFAAASLRFFAAILSWLPLGLGFFWQLWDKDGLTWHDRLSGTRLRHFPKPK